jgi:hypothetical protein
MISGIKTAFEEHRHREVVRHWPGRSSGLSNLSSVSDVKLLELATRTTRQLRLRFQLQTGTLAPQPRAYGSSIANRRFLTHTWRTLGGCKLH